MSGKIELQLPEFVTVLSQDQINEIRSRADKANLLTAAGSNTKGEVTLLTGDGRLMETSIRNILENFSDVPHESFILKHEKLNCHPNDSGDYLRIGDNCIINAKQVIKNSKLIVALLT